jgi:hypothetical protein
MSALTEWHELVATHGTQNFTLQNFSDFLITYKAQRDDARAKIAALEQCLDAVTTRLADLEARTGTLEAEPKSLAFRGLWDGTQTYHRGESVTSRGSTWIALKETRQCPDEHGSAAHDWTLAARRGRNGKDLR